MINYIKMKKKEIEFKRTLYTYATTLLSGFIALNYDRAVKTAEASKEIK